MTAIAAVSRTVKTMADGTLRLTVDIEPMHANEAFALFGAGNVPMALAALNVGTQISDEPKEPELRGGKLARLAGMLIKNPEFWQYLDACCEGLSEFDRDSADTHIKTVCGITSKTELDNFDWAAENFHRYIRQPFLAWQENRLPPI